MRKLIGVVVASALAVATLGGVATAKAGNATLNVVHGIPGLTVDVCVDGATAIPDFAARHRDHGCGTAGGVARVQGRGPER